MNEFEKYTIIFITCLAVWILIKEICVNLSHIWLHNTLNQSNSRLMFIKLIGIDFIIALLGGIAIICVYYYNFMEGILSISILIIISISIGEFKCEKRKRNTIIKEKWFCESCHEEYPEELIESLDDQLLCPLCYIEYKEQRDGKNTINEMKGEQE